MSRDDLFAAEEDGIASGEQLIADGSSGGLFRYFLLQQAFSLPLWRYTKGHPCEPATLC